MELKAPLKFLIDLVIIDLDICDSVKICQKCNFFCFSVVLYPGKYFCHLSEY